MPFPPAVRLALAWFLALACLTVHGPAQCPTTWPAGDPIPHPTGSVYASALWDPDGAGPSPLLLVVGGRFKVGSMVDTTLAAYDGSQWIPLGSPPVGTSGPGVCTALAVYNGQLVAALVGTSYGGNALAAFDGTSWQSLGQITTQANFPVKAMTVYQGELVVGGSFSNIGGQPVASIARWNGSAWSGLSVGTPGRVNALTVFAGALYAGGDFTSMGGVACGHLAAWNGSWSATPVLSLPVRTLAARNTVSPSTSYLFVGGDFSTVGTGAGQLTSWYAARMSGTSPPVWSALPGLNNPCTKLHVRIINQLSFELTAAVINSSFNKIYRWNGSTWSGTGGQMGPQSDPTLLTYFGGRLIVGREGYPYYTDALLEQDSIGRLSPVVGLGINGPVHAVLTEGDDIIIGGSFTEIDGVPMGGIARGRPGAWTPLGAGFDGDVYALARLPNGDLVAGGSFGSPWPYVARWDSVTATWLPVAGSFLNGWVRALLALPNGDLIAGGSFTAAGFLPMNRIARLTAFTWTQLGAGTDYPVWALTRLPNGDIVAGGSFTLAGGAPAPGLARWNGSGWAPIGSFPGSLPVYALAVRANGDLLVGGAWAFPSYAPLHSWNGSTWTNEAIAIDNDVRALLPLPSGDFYVAGSLFTPLFGQASFIARHSGSSEFFLDLWGDGAQSVNALALTASGELVAGGDFEVAGGQPSARVALQVSTCPATAVAYGAGCSGSAGPVVMTVVQPPWIGDTYRATTTGIAPGALALDLLGLQSNAFPLWPVHPSGAGCTVYVDSPVTQLLLPVNGAVTSQLALPNSSSFIGFAVFDQVVQLEFGPAGLTGISSSNALQLTIGWH